MKCKTRISLVIFCFFLVSFISVGEALAQVQPALKPHKKIETPWQIDLHQVAKVFRQADAVVREMWWVVSNDRKPVGRTPFGRLQRALVKEAGGKLPKSISFKCDTYLLKKLGVQERPLKVEVFESCNNKKQILLATWILESGEQIQVDFYPINWPDELGLGASVMNKKTHCELRVQGSNLQLMNCQDWAQDRSKTEVVDLSTFIYTADQESILQVKGVVLEGMNPKSKIESKVPLKGRIIVTESETQESLPLPSKPLLEESGPTAPKEPATIPPRIIKQKPSAEPLPEPEYIQEIEPGAPAQAPESQAEPSVR